MAGPETSAARGGIDVDEIIESGVASTGLGAGVGTSTTGAAPVTPSAPNPVDPSGSRGGRPRFDISAPEWATPPSQEDLGQVDVRRGNYDTGMVPTARMQLPFAALANRQMANQIRKQNLDKQLAEFDLYSKVGKAADPYQRNFGQVARADMDAFVNEIAMAYGGDRRQAIRAIATDPELKMKWRDRSAKWEEVGQVSQSLFKDATDLLIKAEMGEVEVADDALQAARDLVSGQGEFESGAAPDVQKMVDRGRRYDRLISREKYFKDFIANAGLDKAMRTWQEQGKLDTVRGLVRLTETERRDYEALIDQQARRMSGMGMGSYDEMKQYLASRLPTSVVVETKLTRPPSAGKGGGDKGASIWVGEVEEGISATTPDAPGTARGEAVDPLGTTINSERAKMKVQRLPLGQIVSKRREPMGPRRFSDEKGDVITMLPDYIERDPSTGKFYISGKFYQETTEEVEGKGATPREKRKGDLEASKTTLKSMPNIRVPLEGNEGRLNEYLGGVDWKSKFGTQDTRATTVKTQAEIDKLPKGTVFTWTDGKQYRKD